jgi:hypothetical protein
VSVGVGEVIPDQKAKKVEVVLHDNHEQIMRLRDEHPELFESGGDSAAVSGEEYRRRLELALQDGLVRERVERLPMASGTGLMSMLAPEHGWVFATEVGPDRQPRLAFVSATPTWGLRKEEDGSAQVDESILTCLTYADPIDADAPAELPAGAYEGVFDAWPEARRAIWHSWMRLTDPANLQPEVRGILRRASELVRDAHSRLTPAERDRVAVALAQRWPYRISRDVGRILDDEDLGPADRVEALRALVAEEGLEPPPPPVPLAPVTEEDVRLVAWMAITPARILVEGAS